MDYTDAIDRLAKSGRSFELPVKWGIDLQWAPRQTNFAGLAAVVVVFDVRASLGLILALAVLWRLRPLRGAGYA